MSFADKLNKEKNSELNGSGGGYFKFKEGANKLRILSEPDVYFADFVKGICYTDCGFQGSPKGLAYVLDYADNQIKLMRIPYGVTEYIASLEENEDYSFNGFPMPFDIVVTAEGAGTKEVKYSVTPRPVRSEVSQEVIQELNNKKTCVDIIEIWKEEQIKKHKADGSWDKEQERKSALKKELDVVRNGNQQRSEDSIEYPKNDLGEQVM